MKNKTYFYILLGIFLFIIMFLFLKFNFVEYIDIYGKNIQDFFSGSMFKYIFLFITNLMSLLGIFIILILTDYFYKNSNNKKIMVIYVLSIISCFIITNIIKFIVKRERPLEQLLNVSGFSFPSGHSSVSMVVYGFIILLIGKNYNGKNKKLYIFICILLVLLTGISRIYFNVHYLSDVFAGYILGFVVLCISNFYLNKLTK